MYTTVCTTIQWTSHFLQSTRNTRPCLTGHPVHIHSRKIVGLYSQTTKKKGYFFNGSAIKEGGGCNCKGCAIKEKELKKKNSEGEVPTACIKLEVEV